MPRRNINFSDQQYEFIDQMVEEGIYANASELVRAAMRRLQEEYDQKEMEWLQDLRVIGENALESFNQGEWKNITSPEDRQQIFDDIKKRAEEDAKRRLRGSS